jgi:hypothetical protein
VLRACGADKTGRSVSESEPQANMTIRRSGEHSISRNSSRLAANAAASASTIVPAAGVMPDAGAACFAGFEEGRYAEIRSEIQGPQAGAYTCPFLSSSKHSLRDC